MAPFLEEVDGKFKGFIPDLMDAIADKAFFDYTLYLSPDGRYGTVLDGNVTGMIGEVYNKKADFAAADLTITEARENYITFTEPFMINQLAALVRREDVEGLNTMEDLANVRETHPNHKPIALGTLRSGATNYFLSNSDDPLAKKIYEQIKMNNDSLTRTISEGIDRVDKQGGYAFIMESASAEHEIANNCKLTMLLDWRNLFPRKYAFALPKDSPYLEHFNNAIKQLKTEGKIDELRRKYWANNCSDTKKAADDKTETTN
ncbi:excitatory amino acid transporter-like protein [Euroglyphus maynei]|uniref:Excitatory amino acid transporter-like protein n=1 Tax=Euroglyphus maynei TaxID=6958 RepID=A0A1Y3BBI1_EURMA|nr:excitatory amino acid transporter-like protein [Euroglyphus maynei]